MECHIILLNYGTICNWYFWDKNQLTEELGLFLVSLKNLMFKKLSGTIPKRGEGRILELKTKG